MAVAPQAEIDTMLANKEALRRQMDALEQRMGFEHNPNATARNAQHLMLADGIRPEDNVLSRELLRLRYPDEA